MLITVYYQNRGNAYKKTGFTGFGYNSKFVYSGIYVFL